MTLSLRGLAALSLLAGASALPAGAARAHVTIDPASAAPGSYYRATLRVPHGCDGLATRALRVEIPAGVFSVKPMPKPGWTLAVERAPLAKAYRDHGREVTEGVKRLSWTGGDLPDNQYEEFVFIAQIAGDLAPGTPLYFKAEQNCGSAMMSWSEIPAAGQKASELRTPAPMVLLAQAQPGVGGNAMSHDHGAAAAAPAPAMPSMTAAIKVGSLTLSPPWTRATPSGAKVGGGYLSITNNGTAPDRLVSLTTAVSGRAEIHEMAMTNNVMTMRPLPNGLEIPPGQTVELKPGGYHLMFMDLKEPMKEGEKVKATLRFEKAGPVDVEFTVQSIGAQAAPMSEHKH